MRSDVVILGGGILGTGLGFFLSHLTQKKVLVLDQAPQVAYHTSSRNTGKVHAPFLYDPKKKRLFARSAYAGYTMWEEYARSKGLPFKKDGVLEVSLDGEGTKRLERYMTWGEQNGLEEKDLVFMDGPDVKKVEPEVRCEAAILCKRDASVDYGVFTRSLKEDAEGNGVQFLLNTKAGSIYEKNGTLEIETTHGTITSKFLVNAAGGMGVDIAHRMGVAKNLTDIHFRGEYWQAGDEYRNLTNVSVYSVPKHSEYPFLDPHWIVRYDGRCEVGPNAVPVFSPYGYTISENMRAMPSKVAEMLTSGAAKMLFDPQFISLAAGEFLSSVSKSVMINRVRQFLPRLDPSRFTRRGTAGIRASVIDSDGKFVPDAVLEEGPSSLHVLNYNSPGATGALPFSVYIVSLLQKMDVIHVTGEQCGQWKYGKVLDQLVR